MSRKLNKNKFMITLIISGGPIMQVDFTANMNVEQAMQSAYNQQDSSIFVYNVQYYGSKYGNLVTMINETYESFPSKTTYAPFYYWELLVNGSPSSSGIDSTILNDNDIVTFELTEYNSCVVKNSTLHIKHSYKIQE